MAVNIDSVATWLIDDSRLTAYVENNDVKFKFEEPASPQETARKVRDLISEQIKGFPLSLLSFEERIERNMHGNCFFLDFRLSPKFCKIYFGGLEKRYSPQLVKSHPRQIQFVSKHPDQMQIFVADFFNEKYMVIDCIATYSIHAIKRMIENQEGIPYRQQKLVLYHGKRLKAERTLSDYDIQDWSFICLFTPPVARIPNVGAMQSLTYVDMESKVVKQFGKAPRWRTVSPGLNLYAVCMNSSCKAFNDVVTIPKKFGEFHMNREVRTSKCPECRQISAPSFNAIFYRCIYWVEGMKRGADGEEEIVKTPKESAPNDKYITFSDQQKAEWFYLTVYTKKKSDDDCTIL